MPKRASVLTVALAFAVLGVAGLATAAGGRRAYFVIAHMANSTRAIDWALEQGANGIEVDLNFDDRGMPEIFQHGGICDCQCAHGNASICSSLSWDGRGGRIAPCRASASPRTLLEHAAKKQALALIVIDSKLPNRMSHAAQRAAGREVIALIRDRLFAAGYGGYVIVSVAKMTFEEYLRSAAASATGMSFDKRVFFTFDQEGNDATAVLTKLRHVSATGRAYGTGISACLPGRFYRGIGLAERNRAAGSVSFVYVWTLDSSRSMERYLKAGAQGVITNYPARLRATLAADGRKLASQATEILRTSSNAIVREANR